LLTEHYFYNCSKEYVDTISPGIFSEITNLLEQLPKRDVQAEINADLFWLLTKNKWSYDSIPQGLATQEMMSLVRLNSKARTGANAFDKEYAEVATEIELMQERKQKLNDAELERLIRRNKVEELREYLTSQDTPLAKFDGDLFRRLIEKVLVHSMVEVTFVFRSGVEVKEILG
jgi:hypothetical protein